MFSNGCFDLLHRRHVSNPNRAKLLGDVLVVAVNPGDSMRRLKGPTRPINPQGDRLHVLAALPCVDHVVPFDEDSPRKLLVAACRDAYVTGGEYTGAMSSEADLLDQLAVRLELLGYERDLSTTGIIGRAQAKAP